MDNNLNKWFAAAKEADPVMTVNEVESVLTQVPSMTNRWSIFQKGATVGSIILLVLSWWFWSGSQSHIIAPQHPKEIQQTDVVVENNTIQPSEQSPKHEVQALVSNRSKREDVQWEDKNPKDSVSINPYTASGYAGFATSNIESGFADIESNNQLTFEELAALGIITDGNMLWYRNVTSHTPSIQTEGDSLMNTPCFSLKINQYGNRRIIHFYTSQDSILTRSKPFWPAAIQIISQQKPDTTLVVVEPFFGKNYEYDFFNETKPLLVPIEVNTVSNHSKYSDDLTLLFWFKPEDAFFNALPQTMASELKVRYTDKTLMHFDSILLRCNKIAKNDAFRKGFDSTRIQRLQSKILVLTPAELKKLNIHTLDSGFTYSNRFKQNERIHYLKVKKEDYRTDIVADNFTFFPLRIRSKDLPFTAVALTSYRFQSVSYFYVYPDSVPYGQRDKLSMDRFDKDIESLIPIKVFGESILWFPPTPELMDALPERVRKQFESLSAPSR